MTKAEGSVESICVCGTRFTIQKYVPYFGSLSPARRVIIKEGQVIINDYCSQECLTKDGIQTETPIPQTNIENKSG